jgi:lipoprotein NlpD
MLKPASVYSLTLIIALLAMVSACAPKGIYHTVKPGQTLYRIAMTYEVDEGKLARINNINDPRQLKVNQKVYIPGVSQLRKVPATATTSSKRTSAPAIKRAPTPQQKKASTVTKASQPKPSIRKSVTTSKPVKGIFAWPVQGKLLNKFGTQGQKVYKGIEIGVPKGTGVTAAASGKVIYSGNAIPGYGNLIILEHSDSFFSVYGFNQKNLAKMDDFVGQGDRIALSGVPPNGQSARLHFEIRKGKSAVNPILYLP